MNGGWLILFVSSIVFPSSGLALGFPYASVWYFGFSAVAAPFVVTVVLYRILLGPALPPGLRPSNFILLVPPALILATATVLLGLVRTLLALLRGTLLLPPAPPPAKP